MSAIVRVDRDLTVVRPRHASRRFDSRTTRVTSSKPSKAHVGNGEFDGSPYAGLECPSIDNAYYLLSGNWMELS